MLKGCHKSIVFLKDTGSELFDEAYFIVKPNIYAKSKRDIIMEAENLASGYTCELPRKAKCKWLLPFLVGTLLGFGVAFTLHFII